MFEVKYTTDVKPSAWLLPPGAVVTPLNDPGLPHRLTSSAEMHDVDIKPLGGDLSGVEIRMTKRATGRSMTSVFNRRHAIAMARAILNHYKGADVLTSSIETSPW